MRIRSQKPDLVYINSKGEALIHNRISDIIRAIHEEGKPVRLLSNGYLLGREKFMAIANPYEEVIAEIKTARNENSGNSSARSRGIPWNSMWRISYLFGSSTMESCCLRLLSWAITTTTPGRWNGWRKP